MKKSVSIIMLFILLFSFVIYNNIEKNNFVIDNNIKKEADIKNSKIKDNIYQNTIDNNCKIVNIKDFSCYNIIKKGKNNQISFRYIEDLLNRDNIYSCLNHNYYNICGIFNLVKSTMVMRN